MSIDSVPKVLGRHGVKPSEGSVHVDMVPAELVEQALSRKEGKLASNGSLVVGPASTPAAAPRTASLWTRPRFTTPSHGAT